MKKKLSVLLALTFLFGSPMVAPNIHQPAFSTTAVAQDFLAPPPLKKKWKKWKKPKVASQSGSSSNSAAVVYAVSCISGDVLLFLGEANAGQYLLWNVGCSFLGPVGGGAALALLDPEQGLISKLLRPEGLRCTRADIGRVDGCDLWLQKIRNN